MEGVTLSNILHWVNPLTWLLGGIRARGRVLHAQWWSPVLAPVYVTVLLLARARGRRVILTVHNVDSHEPAAWKRLADRVVMRLADHYIVHTRRNAAALAGALPRAAGRTSVIPMGPQDITARRGISRADAKRELGLTGTEPIILFFGNLRSYKGLDTAVDAFASVRELIPEARLVVVGQPWSGSTEVPRTLDRARAMPCVILKTEYVSDHEAEIYFSAADVVIFPYRKFEAQSGAAARALSFGRAMIVSDVGGLPEMVLDERAVVPPGDADRLSRAIVQLLSNAGLKGKLEADAEKIAAVFSWESIASLTAAVYAEVAESVSPAPYSRQKVPASRDL
jgi:glycosyltransferase involved in cell wall biosynthesis